MPAKQNNGRLSSGALARHRKWFAICQQQLRIGLMKGSGARQFADQAFLIS
jgi:hypothetical protein